MRARLFGTRRKYFHKFDVLGSVRGFQNLHGHGDGAAAQVPNAHENIWCALEGFLQVRGTRKLARFSTLSKYSEASMISPDSKYSEACRVLDGPRYPVACEIY